MVVSVKSGDSWVEIPALKGSDGTNGTNGTDGSDYVITNADYAAIAQLVYTNHLTNATNVGY